MRRARFLFDFPVASARPSTLKSSAPCIARSGSSATSVLNTKYSAFAFAFAKKKDIFARLFSSKALSAPPSPSPSLYDLPFVDSRDVFVCDHTYDMNRFLQASQTPMYFRHHTSNHSAALYLSELYRSSDYNFSAIGEFSLNLTAVHAYKTNIGIGVPRPTSWFDKSNDLRHTIYVWPEGIVIHNVAKQDISHICKYIGKSDKIKLDQMAKKLSEGAVIESFSNKQIVVSAVSKVSSPRSALQVLKWIELSQLVGRPTPSSSVLPPSPTVSPTSASTTSSSSTSPSSFTPSFSPSPTSEISATTNIHGQGPRQLELLVAAELREHRSKSSVLLLPSDLSFEALDTYDRVLQAVRQADAL